MFQTGPRKVTYTSARLPCQTANVFIHPGIARSRWPCFTRAMEIRNREAQSPFTTKDGSTIRSLLDRSNAPVVRQSLAEATLPAGTATDRHYHQLSEEFYYLLEGRGLMEIDGQEREVGPGDAILIPAGAWHRIHALEPLRFLCCCAPPYAHEDTYF
jgi:mannose-6-phosphate isomerase-like protein (cupin superfamily)